MKRICSMICLAVALCALMGCSVKNKEPMTANQFKTTMESKGFTVKDNTESANGDSSYQSIYVSADETKYSFEYYFMTDVESAKNVFSYAASNLDSTYKDDSSAVILSNETDESGKYEVSASDYYCVVWQNKNTVLYMTSYIDSKAEAASILKDLGY